MSGLELKGRRALVTGGTQGIGLTDSGKAAKLETSQFGKLSLD